MRIPMFASKADQLRTAFDTWLIRTGTLDECIGDLPSTETIEWLQTRSASLRAPSSFSSCCDISLICPSTNFETGSTPLHRIAYS